ncbi:hypothetical protein L7F22_009161 [Adiantum nelumboides]|nr:hypothetical protein [Adiantum nelumboides]
MSDHSGGGSRSPSLSDAEVSRFLERLTPEQLASVASRAQQSLSEQSSPTQSARSAPSTSSSRRSRLSRASGPERGSERVLDENKEKKSRESWKDAWVVQLNYIRGAKHGEVGQTPTHGVDPRSQRSLLHCFPSVTKMVRHVGRNGGEFTTHTRVKKLTTQSQARRG